jgi:hypothetical protein
MTMLVLFFAGWIAPEHQVRPARPSTPVARGVPVNPRAARAHGIAEGLRLPVGAFVIGLDGTALQVRADGGLDPWPPPSSSKTIAADPTAVAGRRMP